MFFADDSYIYCAATSNSAFQVLSVLDVYKMASGQKFNEADERTQYLGLANVIGRNKSSALGYLTDRMQHRVESWDKRQLSKGGKKIMLKTVVQELPIYAMSIFLLPNRICKDIERIMSRYWWKFSGRKEKVIHWMCRANMCKKKTKGGLGFKDMHDFNLSLLGRKGYMGYSSKYLGE
ncbi:uncharacterized protein LOC141691369 [Apium graveolens]|uniref:uncharacterized protein LOC141691369 n=1 Tax=Apium graveolens TaxID=4045 RepID=UPI003D7AA967